MTPDKYILSSELELLDGKIGEKNFLVSRDSSGALQVKKASEERRSSQVFNNYEIQRIGDFYEKAAEHFGAKMRLEFEIDESGIHILQAEEERELSFEEELRAPKVSEEKKVFMVEKVEKTTKTKMKLVLESPYRIDEGEKSGLKKVGVLRLEEAIQKKGKHPFFYLESHYINEYENLIYNSVKPVFENFEDVCVMTSDFLENEFVNLEGGGKFGEINPLLGLHGIRFGLKYPDILEAELRAIKRAVDGKAAEVFIPNIISIGELKKVKEMLKKINFENVKVGVSIDTPASVQLIKDFCSEGVNSVSVNTDRLLDYLLALDRENKNVAALFDETHPSFLYQLEYLLRVAKRNNVETNLCGSSVKNESVLKYVIQKGISFISVKPEDAKEVSEKVYAIENDFLNQTDNEPRKYELEKEKDEYIERI
jgi:phosphoenolpyruvate-protein kinase (PTS system EI component)